MGELVEARVDLPGRAKRVLEGDLGVYYPFETVVSRDLNAICLNLRLIYFVFVVWGIDRASAEGAMRLSKSVRIVGGLGHLIGAKVIVGSQAGPGRSNVTLGALGTNSNGRTRVKLPRVLLSELEVLPPQVINHV